MLESIYHTLSDKISSSASPTKMKRHRIAGILSTILIVSVFLLNSWPLLTGDVAYNLYADTLISMVKAQDFHHPPNIKNSGNFLQRFLMILEFLCYQSEVITWPTHGDMQGLLRC